MGKKHQHNQCVIRIIILMVNMRSEVQGGPASTELATV
jgi:hypothetical protein